MNSTMDIIISAFIVLLVKKTFWIKYHVFGRKCPNVLVIAPSGGDVTLLIDVLKTIFVPNFMANG